MHKKRALEGTPCARALLMCLALCAAVGCVSRIEYHIEWRPSGDETAQLIMFAPGAGPALMAKSMRKREDLFDSVAVRQVAGKKAVVGTKVYTGGQIMVQVPPGAVDEDLEAGRYALGFATFYEFRFRCSFEPAELKKEYSALLQDPPIPFSYHIQMPGTVSSHNAHHVRDGVLVWDYAIRPNETVDISASSRQVNYGVSVVSGLALVGLVYWVRRRRAARNATAADTPPAAG